MQEISQWKNTLKKKEERLRGLHVLISGVPEGGQWTNKGKTVIELKIENSSLELRKDFSVWNKKLSKFEAEFMRGKDIWKNLRISRIKRKSYRLIRKNICYL